MPQKKSIKISKKGTFDFPKGYYVYTGSAKRGLKGRISRHLNKDKKKFWHIDYLLPYAQIKDIVIRRQKSECYWNNGLSKSRGSWILVKGFGSSDCQCPTHLLHFKKKPELDFSDESDNV
jgi:Uri superfamily endonuclease